MAKKQRALIDDKFGPKVIIKLIPDLENNPLQYEAFIKYFTSYFDNEQNFVKFVSEANRHYLEDMILEFYNYFLEDKVLNEHSKKK